MRANWVKQNVTKAALKRVEETIRQNGRKGGWFPTIHQNKQLVSKAGMEDIFTV